MEDKLVGNLVRARAALKEKLRSLKADMARSQREIDIQYAPISEPLKEIAMKLEHGQLGKKKDTYEESDSFSDLIPKKHHGIPGTSILKQATTPVSTKHVGWFSPGVHSSPTKKIKFQDDTDISIQPSKISPPSMSLGLPSPSFLEDEYIGEYLPETPKATTKDDSTEELDSAESLDLDKSMGHALSLLQTRPSKSILANKSLNMTLLDSEVVKESLKGHDPTIRPYLIGLMVDDREEFDEKYGIREDRGTLKMGTADIGFDGPNIIIGEFTYKATKGLLELLFKKNPSKFTYNDAKSYKFILKDTNASRVGYDPLGKLSATRLPKYGKIIKPILEGKKPDVWWARNWKTGLGLQKHVLPLKKFVQRKSKMEYKYWDDVNELCERLKLLVASKNAGHTGHDNEITAIIEELRESKIIS